MKGIKSLLMLVSLFVVFSLCVNAYAVTPYETRTIWGGGKIWCDGSTGATVRFRDYVSESTTDVVNIGVGRTNALWVKNDSNTQPIFIKFNGRVSNHTVGLSNQVSANTLDFELKAGEEIWLDPFTCDGFEATGNTNVTTEGYLRYLGLFGEE